MSWALRSLLSRPHALLLSRLRPVRRRASDLTTVLGGRRNLIGSRGYASNPSGDLHPEVKKRHLYVVLDDHEDGYDIHRLDLGGDDHDGALDDGGARHLPKPPVVRVTLDTVGKRAQFARVGSSIVAIGSTRLIGCYPPLDDLDIGVVLVYDTETSSMAVTPHLPAGLAEDGHKAAMAVGNRLYMLESASEPAWRSYKWNGGGNVHCLAQHGDRDGGGWSYWSLLSSHSRWCWSHDRGKPLTLPFWADYITAYAAHAPAEHDHEIVVSVRVAYDRNDRRLDAGTFAFSTASLEWTRRGDWQMPVHGNAHYDGGLDAWVGLHAFHEDGDMDRPRVTDGRLCVGQITSAPTEWKVGMENVFLFDEDIAAGWRHLDAKLVPMAPREGGGEYCLMERLLPLPPPPPEGDKEQRLGGDYEWSAGEKQGLLRLTTFHVERGHDGEPVATAWRPARFYRLSRYNRYFDPQAFWM